MHRHEFYQRIHDRIPAIVADARRAGDRIGTAAVAGEVGLYSGASSCPARLPSYVLDAIVESNRVPVLPLRAVADGIRELVKGVYGDDYDVAVTNTCEASLRVAFETLFAPPMMRKGDAYRARVICPYGEDFEWGAGYGRAFPPRYKNLAIDRTVAGGELGVEGKSLNNLDSLFVRYAGARYEVHGIRPNVVPLLTGANAGGTLAAIRTMSERHAFSLTGFHAIGYDTPGYGHGEHDGSGVPRLLAGIGDLARGYDLPYVVDAASCLPIVGLGPADLGADVMVWSMDKAGRSPIAGLMIGLEESMLTIRKSLGLAGPRWGGVSSHGKAVHSIADPGRDSLAGLLAFLKVLRDEPERVTRPVRRYHEILVEEFAGMRPQRFRDRIVLTCSLHMGGTELNYAGTWSGEGFGIPIFNLEDLNANTNAIALATEAMGVEPPTIYAGNMFLGPGLGLLDDDGDLIEERTRLAVRALVAAIGIVCDHAGVGD